MIFNWVDYAIIGVIIFSVLISIVRGFVREALSLITWIAAVWVSIHFHSIVSVWLEPYISTAAIRMAAAFFALFCMTLLAGSILSFIIVQFIHKTGLSGTDRSLGIVFGLARGCLIASIGLLIATLLLPSTPTNNPQANNDESILQHSQLAPHFKPIMDWLQQFLPDSSHSATFVPNAINQVTNLSVTSVTPSSSTTETTTGAK